MQPKRLNSLSAEKGGRMEVNTAIGLLIATPVALFFVYLIGRLFGLGFATSIKQVNKERK